MWLSAPLTTIEYVVSRSETVMFSHNGTYTVIIVKEFGWAVEVNDQFT